MAAGLLIPDLLRHRALTTPDRPFLTVVGEGSYTYGEMAERAQEAAAGLARLGVRAEDRVLVMGANSVAAVSTWLGIALLGAVEVAVNTGARGDVLAHLVENADARLAVVDDDLAARFTSLSVHPVPLVSFGALRGGPQRVAAREPEPQSIASVIYTSGTTGPAKGVQMPFAQVRSLARTVVDRVRLGSDDVFYCFHPLFHMAGKFMAVLGMMTAGGQVVLDRRFSAEAWLERVREYGATVSLAHGPMVEMIHAQPRAANDHDNPVTRIIASPLPSAIAGDFERRFALRGIETWGMTEINVPVWRDYDAVLRPGCSGRVLEDQYELRVADPNTDEPRPAGVPGELLIRPRDPFTTMQGYLRQPAATVQAWRNLWFHTGDLGYVDQDGLVYFVDRLSERIRRRGENISSYEIEACVRNYPGVLDCAAVGVGSGFDGDDDVKVCLVSDRDRRVDPVDLIEYLAGRLPHYMVPRYVEFLEELPVTPTKKTVKSVLRQSGVTERTWDRVAAGISIRRILADSE